MWRSVFIFAATVLSTAGCASRHLSDHGKVPDFSLVSQTGEAITLSKLLGKVWIGDTFFTTCNGPCPMMSARLRRVSQQLKSHPEILLVSITVDPVRDNQPAVLEYSRRFQADPTRWFFLTGSTAALNDLAFTGMHLSKVDGSLEHSTLFALVDRKAVIRGYYSSFETDEMNQLVADALQVASAN